MATPLTLLLVLLTVLLGAAPATHAVPLEVTSGSIGTDSFTQFDTGFSLAGSDFLIQGVAVGGSGVSLIFSVDPLQTSFHTGIPTQPGQPLALINGVEYSGSLILNFTLEAPLFPIVAADNVRQDFDTPFTMTGQFTAAGGSIFDLHGFGIAHSTFLDLCPGPGICPDNGVSYRFQTVDEPPTLMLMLVAIGTALLPPVLRRRRGDPPAPKRAVPKIGK